jgi:hypothetical protein
MGKLCFGALTVALIAAAGVPVLAQTAPAPAAATETDTGQSIPPAGARTYIVNIKDGDTVTSPFKVVFGLTPNMGIAPAGVEKPNVGHHHLLIDTTLTPDELSAPIAADDQHIHFGKGQTETTLKLPPGKHTLQLVLGNWTHLPFAPSVQSEVITVNVVDGASQKSGAATPSTDAKSSNAAMQPAAATPKAAQMKHPGNHKQVMYVKAIETK